jgi:stage III sporulation protein AC
MSHIIGKIGGQMGIGLIFKIGAVGIIVSLLNQILKHSGRDDHAYLVSLAALVIVLSWLVPYIYELFSSISQMFSLE